MSAGIVFQQMLVIFCVVFSGYLAYKKGIIKEGISKGISALVVNVCNPALIITSALDRDESVTYEKMLIAVLAVIVVYAILIISSFVIPRVLRVEKKWKNHYALMCLFGNNAFIGIPVVSAVLGQNAVIYVAVMIVFFNILFYTYGLVLCDGEKSRFSIRNFMNIGNAAILIMLVIFIFDLKIPVIFSDALGHMANATTFLALSVVGINLAQTRLVSIFTNRKLYWFVALRFILVPILAGVALRMFVQDELIYGVMIIMAAVPVANMPLMRIEETGGDGSLLSQGVIFSTICALITIPLVTLFV